MFRTISSRRTRKQHLLQEQLAAAQAAARPSIAYRATSPQARSGGFVHNVRRKDGAHLGDPCRHPVARLARQGGCRPLPHPRNNAKRSSCLASRRYGALKWGNGPTAVLNGNSGSRTSARARSHHSPLANSSFVMPPAVALNPFANSASDWQRQSEGFRCRKQELLHLLVIAAYSKKPREPVNYTLARRDARDGEPRKCHQ